MLIAGIGCAAVYDRRRDTSEGVEGRSVRNVMMALGAAILASFWSLAQIMVFLLSSPFPIHCSAPRSGGRGRGGCLVAFFLFWHGYV